MKRFIRLLLFSLLLLTLVACTPSETEREYTIPVMLAASDGIEVTGDNPVSVRPGEDAVFAVTLEAGYSIRESDIYTYADGTLTIQAVRYPSTVEAALAFDSSMWAGLSPDQIPTEGIFSYEVRNENETLGKVKSSVAGGQPSGSNRNHRHCNAR